MKKTAVTATDFFNTFPLFDCLNDEEKARLVAMSELRVKSRYNFIYLPDEISDTIFFLAKGAIKIGTHSADGKEVIKSQIGRAHV